METGDWHQANEILANVSLIREDLEKKHGV